MATPCKGFNSKCFLFSYLIIVGFLIVLWMNRMPLMVDDQREIPVEMQLYLESPPRLLPPFVLNTKEKLALTNDWFLGKWSFVYFTHGNCLPECQASLAKMQDLQSAFANIDFQFLAIGIDPQQTANQLAQFLVSQDYQFTAAVAAETEIDKLSKTFIALFLQTDFSDGNYLIEQHHHLFLVDPKGRVYATFRPPFNDVRSSFLAIRHFYARTE